MSTELTERDREILAFERTWWKYQGAKEDEIRRRFNMSATRYYQVLVTLLKRPEALAHDPMTVRRLQRLQRPRRSARAAR